MSKEEFIIGIVKICMYLNIMLCLYVCILQYVCCCLSFPFHFSHSLCPYVSKCNDGVIKYIYIFVYLPISIFLHVCLYVCMYIYVVTYQSSTSQKLFLFNLKFFLFLFFNFLVTKLRNMYINSMYIGLCTIVCMCVRVCMYVSLCL